MENPSMDQEQHEFSWLTRLLAWRCEICPMCRFARSNPHAYFSKIMRFHGRFCPAWRAHVKVYGHPEEE